jgi:hypothetical protein
MVSGKFSVMGGIEDRLKGLEDDRARRNQRKIKTSMKTRTSRKAGFTLVEIMIVVALQQDTSC